MAKKCASVEPFEGDYRSGRLLVPASTPCCANRPRRWPPLWLTKKPKTKKLRWCLSAEKKAEKIGPPRPLNAGTPIFWKVSEGHIVTIVVRASDTTKLTMISRTRRGLLLPVLAVMASVSHGLGESKDESSSFPHIPCVVHSNEEDCRNGMASLLSHCVWCRSDALPAECVTPNLAEV